MSVTRIHCRGGCGFVMMHCQCEKQREEDLMLWSEFLAKVGPSFDILKHWPIWWCDDHGCFSFGMYKDLPRLATIVCPIIIRSLDIQLAMLVEMGFRCQWEIDGKMSEFHYGEKEKHCTTFLTVNNPYEALKTILLKEVGDV